MFTVIYEDSVFFDSLNEWITQLQMNPNFDTYEEAFEFGQQFSFHSILKEAIKPVA